MGSVCARAIHTEVVRLRERTLRSDRERCPAAVGVTDAGATVQVGGAPAPQVRFTTLAYPFTALSVPLNVADWLAVADCGELLIASV